MGIATCAESAHVPFGSISKRGMNNEAEDTDSEATTGDDLLLWYFLEDSEDDKASPLWVWVCVLVVIAVAFIVALCS